MKITELVLEQEQIDEISAAGVGQTVGKAAGGLVKGTGNFFKGLKQGYKSATAPDGTQQPATQQAPAQSAPVDNKEQIKAQIAQKKQELKDLQSQLTKAEPGIGQANNTVAATATNTPAAQQTAQGVAPQAETPPVEPGIGQQSNTVAATASNTAQPAAAQPTPAQTRQQKQAAAAKTAQAQMAANPAPAKPGNYDPNTGAAISDKAKADAAFDASPEGQQMDAYVDALTAGTFKGNFQQWKQQQQTAQAPAAAAEPNANKPSADAIKQAQLKKNLMKNQQARAAAPAAPSGFAASGVGQARQRTYAGTGGAPKSYTVREGVEFYSKFLGKNI